MKAVIGDDLHGRLTRRGFVCCSATVAASLGMGGAASAATTVAQMDSELAIGVVNQFLPAAGIRTETIFADSLQKLIAAGALDPVKYRAAYDPHGRVPVWVERLLTANSAEPIVFSSETAPYLLNLLWPLGLATKTKFNTASPLNTTNLPNFASTGGWTLGRASSGSIYFNRIESLRLTDVQDARTYVVATNAFRPCCDNSTFFQDCNHGSALLGLLELAASQGATERDLYWLAKLANSYWFPGYYLRTALHFALIRQSWDEVDPQLVMSKRFSTLDGWRRNVYEPQRRAQVILPNYLLGQASC